MAFFVLEKASVHPLFIYLTACQRQEGIKIERLEQTKSQVNVATDEFQCEHQT